MREDIRKARVEKYGSFLYCSERDVLCFGMYNEYGICSRTPCCLDDPEYLAKKKRIRENIQRNAKKFRKDKEEEKLAKENMNKGNGSKKQTIAERIRKLEEKSQILYRQNKPNLAEKALNEAQMLKGEIRRI